MSSILCDPAAELSSERRPVKFWWHYRSPRWCGRKRKKKKKSQTHTQQTHSILEPWYRFFSPPTLFGFHIFSDERVSVVFVYWWVSLSPCVWQEKVSECLESKQNKLKRIGIARWIGLGVDRWRGGPSSVVEIWNISMKVVVFFFFFDALDLFSRSGVSATERWKSMATFNSLTCLFIDLFLHVVLKPKHESVFGVSHCHRCVFWLAGWLATLIFGIK